MMKQKTLDIKNYDMRKDYSQVLAVMSDSFEVLKSCMHRVVSEDEIHMREQ